MLARPKSRPSVSTATTAEFVDGLAEDALVIDDPPTQCGVSPDLDDDYLVTLARAGNADYLVSGDRHLIGLALVNPPVLTPRQFVDLLTEVSGEIGLSAPG